MIETPVGFCSIEAREGFLTRCVFSQAPGLHLLGGEQRSSKVVDHVKEALDGYFAGDLYALSEIPIWPVGTLFQLKIWRELLRIPPGSVRSYSEIAAAVGKPAAARAVGSACGANPLLLFVPCHRVVNAQGTTGGYAGGTRMKLELLRHEHRASAFTSPPYTVEHLAPHH